MAARTASTRCASTIEVTVFQGSELKGSRRFDSVADSREFIEQATGAGLRALPISPAALQGWLERQRSAAGAA